MNFLQSIGGALLGVNDLQAEAQAAQEQITLAAQTMIALTAANTLLLVAIVYLVWTGKN